VHVFPADLVTVDSGSVPAHAGGLALTGSADEAMPGTVVDPSEFLDVDVDQLTRPVTLITLSRFQPEPAELPHPGSL
jgi:hypothetical protein